VLFILAIAKFAGIIEKDNHSSDTVSPSTAASHCVFFTVVSKRIQWPTRLSYPFSIAVVVPTAMLSY